MSRYLWVVKFNDQLYLGSDLNSMTTVVTAAHMFNSAEDADKFCPAPIGSLVKSEVIKVLAFIEEIR